MEKDQLWFSLFAEILRYSSSLSIEKVVEDTDIVFKAALKTVGEK